MRGRPAARAVNQALHHCTGSPCIPVPDHALASLPAPQLLVVWSSGFHILCRLLVGELSVLLAGAGRTAGPGRRPCWDGAFACARARIQRSSGRGEVRTTPVPASDRRRTTGVYPPPSSWWARKSKLWTEFSRSLIPQKGGALHEETSQDQAGWPVNLLRRPSALSLRAPSLRIRWSSAASPAHGAVLIDGLPEADAFDTVLSQPPQQLQNLDQ